MKILILGNGFECQYNPNVRNFNQKFVEFINDDEKIKKLIQKIITFCYHDKQIYQSIVATIRNEIKFNDNFVLEAELRDIGNQLANTPPDTLFVNEELIFHCLKNLVGAIIHEFTKDYQEIDQYLDFWMKACPDQIWTTNYTDSAQNAYRSWTKNSLFKPVDLMGDCADSLLRGAKVVYLHGQFLFQAQPDSTLFGDNYQHSLQATQQLSEVLEKPSDYSNVTGSNAPIVNSSVHGFNQINKILSQEQINTKMLIDDHTFQNIEINLAKKNERPLKGAISQILWNKDEAVKIDVFGLSVNNDEGLFEILLSELERSNIDYQLNFYYYTEVDKKNFEAFKKQHLNNNFVVNPMVHYNLASNQKATEKRIRIIPSKEYKGFKLKKS